MICIEHSLFIYLYWAVLFYHVFKFYENYENYDNYENFKI